MNFFKIKKRIKYFLTGAYYLATQRGIIANVDIKDGAVFSKDKKDLLVVETTIYPITQKTKEDKKVYLN